MSGLSQKGAVKHLKGVLTSGKALEKGHAEASSEGLMGF